MDPVHRLDHPDPQHVVGERARAIGEAVAGQIDRHHALHVRAELVQERHPVQRRRAEPVEQHDRRQAPASGARQDVQPTDARVDPVAVVAEQRAQEATAEVLERSRQAHLEL